MNKWGQGEAKKVGMGSLLRIKLVAWSCGPRREASSSERDGRLLVNCSLEALNGHLMNLAIRTDARNSHQTDRDLLL